VDRDPISRVQRRVGGPHDYRMDGLTDLLVRAQGMSVLDVGCNRGMIAHEFACHGARMVHGCDHPEAEGDTVFIARRIFADIRQVQSRFESCDLSLGPSSLAVFGNGGYDIVLLFATYHKLKRQMSSELLAELIRYLGLLTLRYFAWRGRIDQETGGSSEGEADEIESAFAQSGHYRMKRVQWSVLSEMGPAAIWRKE
jgi:hypothetical protein